VSGFLVTAPARDDLDEIWAFVADGSEESADRVIGALFEAMKLLAAFPGMGHRRAEFAQETVRTWPVRAWIIVYDSESRPIEVTRVVSAAADLWRIRPS
jgi:plasmid stabilization system protein ParE